jgi:hypothetical protein
LVSTPFLLLKHDHRRFYPAAALQLGLMCVSSWCGWVHLGRYFVSRALYFLAFLFGFVHRRAPIQVGTSMQVWLLIGWLFCMQFLDEHGEPGGGNMSRFGDGECLSIFIANGCFLVLFAAAVEASEKGQWFAQKRQGLEKDVEKGMENVRAISNVIYVSHVACIRLVLALGVASPNGNALFLLAAVPFAAVFISLVPPQLGLKAEIGRSSARGRLAPLTTYTTPQGACGQVAV